MDPQQKKVYRQERNLLHALCMMRAAQGTRAHLKLLNYFLGHFSLLLRQSKQLWCCQKVSSWSGSPLLPASIQILNKVVKLCFLARSSGWQEEHPTAMAVQLILEGWEAYASIHNWLEKLLSEHSFLCLLVVYALCTNSFACDSSWAGITT